jgi:hypothetical protein
MKILGNRKVAAEEQLYQQFAAGVGLQPFFQYSQTLVGY